MLPKLAEIFGTTTDALLGYAAQEKAYQAEVVNEEVDDSHKGSWEFCWDGGKRGSIGVAIWILLVGIQLLAANVRQWNVGLWELLWPNALLVFGIFGLFPRFSFFRLGCALFGGYYLLVNLNAQPFDLGRELLLGFFLLLFGLSLLVDTLRKPKRCFIPGHRVQTNNHSSIGEESFDCALSFGEEDQPVQLPRLSGGTASVSFGEMTLDLTGCAEISDGCPINATCSFGVLQLLVPKWCRVDINARKAFAEIDIKGTPDPNPRTHLILEGSVSFGELTVRYI